MRIWHLPIEPIADRYSEQWARWVPTWFTKAGHSVVTLGGYAFTDGIEQGQFLDVLGTNHYKATQLALFAQQLHAGAVLDGDWVFLADAWSPAVISLAYMRDLGRVKFKVAGCLHAGSWDPHDLLGQTRRVRQGWGSDFEAALLEALDVAFVATRFHRQLIMDAGHSPPSSRIVVTGFPLYEQEWVGSAAPWRDRPRRVVFPHRLAPEKNPMAFDDLRATYEEMYPGDEVEWVRTRDACWTKDDYYALLGRSRVAFSSAYQETWGIAMLEAASLGCHPVVPDRLSYRELYADECRYQNLQLAARRVRVGLEHPEAYDGFDAYTWHTSIARMASVMELR